MRPRVSTQTHNLPPTQSASHSFASRMYLHGEGSGSAEKTRGRASLSGARRRLSGGGGYLRRSQEVQARLCIGPGGSLSGANVGSIFGVWRLGSGWRRLDESFLVGDLRVGGEVCLLRLRSV